MKKIWIIFKREYLTRVTKKSFLLATILTPLGIAAFYVALGFIVASKGGDKMRIAVVDEGRVLKTNLKDEDNLFFVKSKEPLDSLKMKVESGAYDAVLQVPKMPTLLTREFTIFIYTDKQLGLEATNNIEDVIADAIREYKIDSLRLDRQQLDALATSVTIDPEPIVAGEENKTSVTGAVAAGLGMIMGMAMYLITFIYGMMVMRSVMEEKTTRIVEVIMSSVKPFQLMMGKILGAGAVGLTQVAIWMILIPLVGLIVPLAMGIDPEKLQSQAPQMNPGDTEKMQDTIMVAMQEIGNQNWALILPLLLVFFLGGYFVYASLFAAVGSAMSDDQGESQGLVLPITLPVVVAVMIMVHSIDSPHSKLAVFGSLFPMFSPIVMPARLAYNPPVWQIVLSVALLIGFAVFCVWLAGRIYRVGILMYGKKVTFKELGKWIFYKS